MSDREGWHMSKTINVSHILTTIAFAVAGIQGFNKLETGQALLKARMDMAEKPSAVSLVEMDKRVSIMEHNMTIYSDTQRKIAADLEVMKDNVTSDLGEIKQLLIQRANSNGPG